MKRKEFERYLNSKNCFLHRNGSKHDIYKNLSNNKKTTVPRHPTIAKQGKTIKNDKVKDEIQIGS